MRHHLAATPDDSPVDIVYLWVDGQDVGWRAKRRHALRQLSADGNHAIEAIARFGNVEGRFRDNDELLYSLRALEKFFPDHGHIYLVTDGQTPDWLKASDCMTLVDHRELIPAASLPTFDSSNIESYIHRIPGLSERYFYFNDDVFFGAPVNLDDWFWPGGFYVTWSDDAEVSDDVLQTDATAPENACRLSNQWLAHKAANQTRPTTGTVAKQIRKMDPLYSNTFRTFAHSPRPMLKSLLWELEEEAAELFDGVRSTVFRIWDKPTIVSDFVLRWALAHGMARVKNYRHRHVSTGDSGQAAELKLLAEQFGALDFFCINDTTDDAHAEDPRLENVRLTLRRMLFKTSEFERPVQVEMSAEDCPAALA
ncbi:MAG: stealth family protein [Polaromonas sp.]